MPRATQDLDAAESGEDVDGSDGAEEASESEPWIYRVQNEVPPYWIPLIPELVSSGSAEMRLRRARMLSWDDIPMEWAKGPKGQVLAPSRALTLHEEEVPRGGVQVTRAWQRARGQDG